MGLSTLNNSAGQLGTIQRKFTAAENITKGDLLTLVNGQAFVNKLGGESAGKAVGTDSYKYAEDRKLYTGTLSVETTIALGSGRRLLLAKNVLTNALEVGVLRYDEANRTFQPTITWSTVYVAADVTYLDWKLIGTDKVVMAFNDNRYNQYKGMMLAFVVNADDTITLGTAIRTQTHTNNYTANYNQLAVLSSTRILLTFVDQYQSKLNGVIYDLNGVEFTLRTRLDMGSSTCQGIRLQALDANRALMVYGDGYNVSAAVLNYDGVDLFRVGVLTFYTQTSGYVVHDFMDMIRVSDLKEQFAIHYQHTNNTGYRFFYVLTVNGTTLAGNGTTVYSESGYSMRVVGRFFRLDERKFMYVSKTGNDLTTTGTANAAIFTTDGNNVVTRTTNVSLAYGLAEAPYRLQVEKMGESFVTLYPYYTSTTVNSVTVTYKTPAMVVAYKSSPTNDYYNMGTYTFLGRDRLDDYQATSRLFNVGSTVLAFTERNEAVFLDVDTVQKIVSPRFGEFGAVDFIEKATDLLRLSNTDYLLLYREKWTRGARILWLQVNGDTVTLKQGAAISTVECGDVLLRRLDNDRVIAFFTERKNNALTDSLYYLRMIVYNVSTGVLVYEKEYKWGNAYGRQLYNDVQVDANGYIFVATYEENYKRIYLYAYQYNTATMTFTALNYGYQVTSFTDPYAGQISLGMSAGNTLVSTYGNKSMVIPYSPGASQLGITGTYTEDVLSAFEGVDAIVKHKDGDLIVVGRQTSTGYLIAGRGQIYGGKSFRLDTMTVLTDYRVEIQRLIVADAEIMVQFVNPAARGSARFLNLTIGDNGYFVKSRELPVAGNGKETGLVPAFVSAGKWAVLYADKSRVTSIGFLYGDSDYLALNRPFLTCVGVALGTVLANEPVRALLKGLANGYTGLSAGRTYYNGKDGRPTLTPSDKPLGTAISETEILLDLY